MDINERIDSYIATEKWRGEDNYECKVCPYADLSRARVREHVVSRHLPVEPARDTGLVDTAGAPIVTEPAVISPPEFAPDVVTEPVPVENLTRAELDDLAAARGFDPTLYPNKSALLEALTDQEDLTDE